MSKLLCIGTIVLIHALSLISCQPALVRRHRQLLSNEPYYVVTNYSVLGEPNETAALGNPLKGLMGGGRWAPLPLPESVPLSMEWYNIGVRYFRCSN